MSIGDQVRKFASKFVMPLGEYRAAPVVLADGEQAPLAINQSGALVVDAVVNVGDISVGIASDGTVGAAVPATANYNGFLDASGNLRGARLYNVNTLGSELVQGVNLRFVTAGASVEAGTVSDPFHVIVDSGGGGGQSEGQNGAAVPTYSTLIGGSDGVNLRAFAMMDGDTGAGSQYLPMFIPMHPANGGAVVAGTASNPLSVNVLSGGGANDSVSATGAAVPASATFVGLRSSAGNLVAFQAYPNSHGNSTDQLPAFVIRGTRAGNYVEIGTATNPVIIEPSAAIDVNVLSGGGSNASVGSTGAAVPASATYVGGLNSSGDLTGFPMYPDTHGSSTAELPAFVLRGTRAGNYEEIGTATNPIYITGGGGGGSAEGTIGDPAPTNINQGGGTDASGNARPERAFDFDTTGAESWVISHGIVLPSASGPQIAGTAGNPLNVAVVSGGGSNSSVSATGAAVPADATFIGGSLAGNLTALPLIDGDTGVGTSAALPSVLVMPSSGGPTVVSASDPLPVAVISGGGANDSVSATGAAVPASATYIGGNFGGNLSSVHVLDGDTGAGSVPTLASALVVPSSGGPTPVSASDPLPVAVISGGGSNASVGSNGAAAPTSSTAIGGTDGTNLQQATVRDLDTAGGTEYALEVNLRFAGSGGSTEAGTASAPIRVDPTGTTTQPISASTLPLPTGASTEATLSTLNGKIPALGQATMAASLPMTIASNQTPLQVVGAAADDAAASGNPVLVAGKYVASPVAVADGDVVTLRTDDLRNLFCRVLGYDPTSDSIKTQEVSPATQAYFAELVASVSSGNGASGNNYYYLDMTGFRNLALQFTLTPGTATLGCTVEMSLQDDLTAQASVTYVDITSDLIGAAQLAQSDVIIIDKPFPCKFLRINVYQSVTTNGAWTIWARKLW